MDYEDLPLWRRAATMAWERRALWLRFDIGLAVAVLLVGGGLLIQGALAAPVPVEATEDRLPFATTVPVTEGPLSVHAAGAVVRPGLYRVEPGARVADVIRQAGGADVDADLDRLNLAAPVADGQQVFVPVVGEPVPASAGTPGADAGGLVDLNTASAARFDDLPGVGPATAAAIVAHRDEHGPFSSVDQLLDVPGIGPSKLASLSDLVVVR